MKNYNRDCEKSFVPDFEFSFNLSNLIINLVVKKCLVLSFSTVRITTVTADYEGVRTGKSDSKKVVNIYLTSGLNVRPVISPFLTPGNFIATRPPSFSSRSSTNAKLPNSVNLRLFIKSCKM